MYWQECQTIINNWCLKINELFIQLVNYRVTCWLHPRHWVRKWWSEDPCQLLFGEASCLKRVSFLIHASLIYVHVSLCVFSLMYKFLKGRPNFRPRVRVLIFRASSVRRFVFQVKVSLIDTLGVHVRQWQMPKHKWQIPFSDVQSYRMWWDFDGKDPHGMSGRLGTPSTLYFQLIIHPFADKMQAFYWDFQISQAVLPIPDSEDFLIN